MINNDTITTAGIFGMTAGISTSSITGIIVGALAVGVIQPLFRVIWTKVLTPKEKVVYKTRTIYRTKPKAKRKARKK